MTKRKQIPLKPIHGKTAPFAPGGSRVRVDPWAGYERDQAYLAAEKRAKSDAAETQTRSPSEQTPGSDKSVPKKSNNIVSEIIISAR